MIDFNQNILEKDYKKAIAIHYFGYKYTLINPILGVVMILGLLFGTLTGLLSIDNKTLLIFLLGVFLILRPFFYVQNVFKSIKSNKMSSIAVNIKITDDNKMITQNHNNISSINLADLYLYCDTKSFLYLYIARNQYIILDKGQIMKEQVNSILDNLKRLGIKKR